MADLFSAEVKASYSTIIDEILRESDINTISAKRIRKGLQERIGYDLSTQKEQITNLIMQRFDKLNSERNAKPEPPSESIPTPQYDTCNHKPLSKDEPGASETRDSAPQSGKKKKKKIKQDRSAEDDDAAFAARLQAEENARTRSTRGGNMKRRAPPLKKKARKKSANTVKDDDDSDVASGSGAEKKSPPARKGGFHKPMALSPALSTLLGETQLSRPQTVKRIWEYIKERDLQDPSDKRQIRCDDALRTVFKQDRVHMFTMNKILNQNLYAVEEVN